MAVTAFCPAFDTDCGHAVIYLDESRGTVTIISHGGASQAISLCRVSDFELNCVGYGIATVRLHLLDGEILEARIPADVQEADEFVLRFLRVWRDTVLAAADIRFCSPVAPSDVPARQRDLVNTYFLTEKINSMYKSVEQQNNRHK